MNYFLPVLFAAVILFACAKKVRVYDSFAAGAANALPLLKNLFPFLASVLILSSLFEASGLSDALEKALAPAFSFVGIPPRLAGLVLVKPFSGSGATAVLSEVFAEYGVESYIARCACVVYAAGETVFYLSAVYFAGIKGKTALPVAIALVANFIAAIAGCWLCRVF